MRRARRAFDNPRRPKAAASTGLIFPPRHFDREFFVLAFRLRRCRAIPRAALGWLFLISLLSTKCRIERRKSDSYAGANKLDKHRGQKGSAKQHRDLFDRG